MKSILGLSAAVAIGLVAGLAILLWWLPTILLLRLSLAPVPARTPPRAGRKPRPLDRGDVAEAERILAREAGPWGRAERAPGWLHRR